MSLFYILYVVARVLALELHYRKCLRECSCEYLMAHVYVLDGVNLSVKARVADQSYVTPLLLMQLLHWSACCIMQVGKQSQNFLLSKRTFVALHHGKLLASLSLLRSIPSYFTIQNVDRSREEEYNISRIHAPILTLFHPLPICANLLILGHLWRLRGSKVCGRGMLEETAQLHRTSCRLSEPL